MTNLQTFDRQAVLAATLSDAYPDARGRFGPFGGSYVPETLVPALNRLQTGVDRYLRDEDFLAGFH
jgi:tryptophan synthase beta chain